MRNEALCVDLVFFLETVLTRSRTASLAASFVALARSALLALRSELATDSSTVPRLDLTVIPRRFSRATN